MKNLSCPICKDRAYFYYKYEDFFGDFVGLYKCINCGHGSHDRQYTADQFGEIYRADYAANYLMKEKELYQQRQVQYSLDVELLLKYRKFGLIKVLDYGCSSGGYLDAMPSEWVKHGFEVNPFHVEHVRQNKKYITVFDNVASIDCQFDLITMRGVIEHMPDHVELLELLNHHLVPGGAVFITATPDFSSVCSALYKDKWNQVVCPEHIHQFSSASLSILLGQAGLVMRSLNHQYMETPYVDLIKDKSYFLDNFMKLKQNPNADIYTKHAFPGNMISALFEK